MIWISSTAIAIALISLIVGLYERLWLGIWKPFKLACDVRAVVWHPPARPGTAFSIIVPFTLTNLGARKGLVRAAFVQFRHVDEGTQYRLEGFASIHPSRVLESLSGSAEPLEGLGAYVTLGKNESKDIGLAFNFPPESAARFKYFDDPEILPFGPYELQFWWLTPGGWKPEGTTQTEFRPEMPALFSAGNPALSMSGQMYDTAPGAPGSPNKAGRFTYDIGDSVRLVSDGKLATIGARFRRMPDIKLDQKPDIHYGVQMVDSGDIRLVLEGELTKEPS